MNLYSLPRGRENNNQPALLFFVLLPLPLLRYEQRNVYHRERGIELPASVAYVVDRFVFF